MEPRISSKDAQAMMNAYAKVYAPPEETPVETQPELSDEVDENETFHYDNEGNIVDLDELESE
jgi:hypothetical protein